MVDEPMEGGRVPDLAPLRARFAPSAAAALAAPYAELHRHSAHPPRTLPAARTATLSMLRTNASASGQAD
jgi:hypothetical protein